MIPKLSAPLTKLIRTGEGVILFAFNAATIVLGAVGDIAPSLAIKYAAILNAVAFASRQALKAVAVAKPLVGGDPDPSFQVAGVTSDQILAEIEAVTGAAKAFQAKPGAPADQVAGGLAPDPPATVSTTAPTAPAA